MAPRRTGSFLALVLVASALAVAVSACGGESQAVSRADYAASVRAIRDRVDFALARITQAQSLDEFLDRMEEAAALIEEAADDLASEGSAQGFERDTRDLAAALRQLSVDLKATASQVREPGFQDLLASARGLSFESWTRANRIIERLRRRGIQVPPLARH